MTEKTQTRRIDIFIDLTDEQRESLKLSQSLNEQSRIAFDKFIRSVRARADLKAARLLVGPNWNHGGSKIEPISGGRAKVSFAIQEKIEEPPPPEKPAPSPRTPHLHPVSIHQSTANMLLNGKLLSEAQKLELLRRMGLDFVSDDDETDGGEEQ